MHLIWGISGCNLHDSFWEDTTRRHAPFLQISTMSINDPVHGLRPFFWRRFDITQKFVWRRFEITRKVHKSTPQVCGTVPILHERNQSLVYGCKARWSEAKPTYRAIASPAYYHRRIHESRPYDSTSRPVTYSIRATTCIRTSGKQRMSYVCVLSDSLLSLSQADISRGTMVIKCILPFSLFSWSSSYSNAGALSTAVHKSRTALEFVARFFSDAARPKKRAPHFGDSNTMVIWNTPLRYSARSQFF